MGFTRCYKTEVFFTFIIIIITIKSERQNKRLQGCN